MRICARVFCAHIHSTNSFDNSICSAPFFGASGVIFCNLRIKRLLHVIYIFIFIILQNLYANARNPISTALTCVNITDQHRFYIRSYLISFCIQQQQKIRCKLSISPFCNQFTRFNPVSL